MRTKQFFIIILSLLFISPSFILANLVDEVDKLSPEEAALVQKKLFAKVIHPIPESIITNLGISFGFSGHIVNFNELHQMGIKNVYEMYGSASSLKYKFSDDIALGVEFGYAARVFISQSSTVTFKNTSINYEYTQFIIDYFLYREDPMIIKLVLGLGTITGSYNIATTEEVHSQEASLITREGSTFCYQIGLESIYNFNPVWNIGLGLSYFNGNIEEFSNQAGITITDSAGLDCTGVLVKAFTGISL